ncbi:unnamed protein product [Sordaria macrospora k-hell]|uniref:WGS project CABT00000000 data, contig 2.1 n=1 Tax=Sordaria macrospora (strain ATCC MYA-333 / DSM 997 / K(L3346) / K-hell) TaxID=771870 RepID=F7VL47_SORMK|nr:uncharacterized protein SMAC_00441 [Sordaria macrospora k-hell]CCC06224.1 unnamed protein product [Sordaria macrospora k-hell]
MAPRKPPPPPVVRLTVKGVPAKRRGPAPKPLSERPWTAPKPVRRVERSYTRERKIEVLQFLLNHRIADYRPRKAPRRRIGQPAHEQEPVPQTSTRDENGQLVWYRAPTYVEASEWWKIPIPTIQGWWDNREKILEGTGIELPKANPGDSPGTVSDQPRPGDRVEFTVNPQAPPSASREGSEQSQPRPQPQRQPTASSTGGSVRGSQQGAARNTHARAISISSSSTTHPPAPSTPAANGPVVSPPILRCPSLNSLSLHFLTLTRPNPIKSLRNIINYNPRILRKWLIISHPRDTLISRDRPNSTLSMATASLLLLLLPPHYGPPHQAPHMPGPPRGHPGYPPYPQPGPGGPGYPPHQGAPYQGGPPPQPHPGAQQPPYVFGPHIQVPMIVQFPQFTPYYATPQAPPYAQPSAPPPNPPPQPPPFAPFAPGGPGQFQGPAPPGMVLAPPFPGPREVRPPMPAPPQPAPGPVNASFSTQPPQAAGSDPAPNPPVTPPRQQPAGQPSDAQELQSESDEASPAGQLLAEQEARNTVQESRSRDQSAGQRPAESIPEAEAASKDQDQEMGDNRDKPQNQDQEQDQEMGEGQEEQDEEQDQDQDQEQDQEMDQDQQDQEQEMDQDVDQEMAEKMEKEMSQEQEEQEKKKEQEQEQDPTADVSASEEADKDDDDNVSKETPEKPQQDGSAAVDSAPKDRSKSTSPVSTATSPASEEEA